MRPQRNCSKCEKPSYASFKGKYYCSSHLEERLAEEKRIVINKGSNGN